MNKEKSFLPDALHTELHAIIANMEKLVLVEGDDVEVFEDKADPAVNVLAFLRQFNRDVESAYKPLVADWQNQIKPYQKEKLALQAMAKEQEAILVNGLTNLVREGKIDNMTTHNDVGFSVQRVPGVELEDASKVPAKYLVPDMAAIKKDVLEGVDVPGVAKTEHYILRTKLPEILDGE